MKTQIKLTVTKRDSGESLAPFFRVKLDSAGKPYIVVMNRKFFIEHMRFPIIFSVDFGSTYLIAEVKEGLPELKNIVEKLSQ